MKLTTILRVQFVLDSMFSARLVTMLPKVLYMAVTMLSVQTVINAEKEVMAIGKEKVVLVNSGLL